MVVCKGSVIITGRGTVWIVRRVRDERTRARCELDKEREEEGVNSKISREVNLGKKCVHFD